MATDPAATLAASLHELAAELAADMVAADDEAARFIGAAAGPLTPHRTGTLAASARFGGGLVSYTAPYAVPVFARTPWALDAAKSKQEQWTAIYVAALTASLNTVRA